MGCVVIIDQSLEGLHGHVGTFLFIGGQGGDLRQTVVQSLRGKGNGLVEGLGGRREKIVVVFGILEIVPGDSGRILVRDQRITAEIAVLGQLDDPRTARFLEKTAEFRFEHVRVVGIVRLPPLQEGLHTDAGEADALDELGIFSLVFFFRSLGRRRKGGKEHRSRT